MSDPAKREPAAVELSSADERALDALLTAALNPRTEPRDFTAAILARLETEAVRLQDPSSPSPPAPAASNRPWALAAVAAALAASALLVLLPQQLRNDFLPLAQHQDGAEHAPGPSTAAPAAGIQSQQPAQADPAAGGGAAGVASKLPRKPPLELSRDEPLAPPPAAKTAEPPQAMAAQSDRRRSQPAAPLATAELEDFNQQFIAYWDAIGVAPAPPIDQAAWAARIADRFGWQPEVASELPQVEIENVFADSQASQELAQRLVDQLLGGLRPSGERREQLVQEAAEVIHRGGRFDRLLSKWVADKAWLDEAAEQRKQDPALVGQWMASRVIGADVGCAQCHDSPIDSRFTQHDFWAMAAAFAPRGEQGDQPVFYELEDGRQRVASPGIPRRWFGLAQEEQAPPLAPPEQLGDLVEGSPQIARTLANHLWTIGFGMPLVAASSSPMAPPRDDALERALAMLGDRLLSNQFDLRAAVQWVIACEPMRRDVPAALAGERWLVADEATLAEASLAQRAFAAAKVTLPQASRGQLLALLQSRSGLIPATLAASDSMLAQPRLRSPQPPGKADGPRRATLSGDRGASDPQVKEIDLQEYWWAQWLADREALRGGWLDSIEDADQQLQHAFYAAGYRHISGDQLEKVKALLDATAQSQQDRSETIAQIHWILQNSR